MVSIKRTVVTSPCRGETEFEGLGRELLDAMVLYVRYLEKENLPPPSLEPATLFTPALTDLVGVAARITVVEIAQKITALAMDPQTNLLVSSLQFHFCSCLKVALDLGIHERISQNGTILAGSLARTVGAEESLIARIMRVLTDKFVFAEPVPGVYTHTAMSFALNQPGMASLLSHRLDEMFKSASREADALAHSGYSEPKDSHSLGFNLAFDTEDEFWKYIASKDTERGQRFDHAMPAVSMSNLDVIPELYPFDELDTAGGLIVDVGGGMGQVAQKILAYGPNKNLRCIVQDLWVSDVLKLDPKIELQRHDFFKEQPVKGAAAYFFRHIFHHWPDEACRQILRQTVKAMDPARSRILICDQILCEYKPSTASLLYDIDMMTMSGGKERTLSEWKQLLRSADPRLCIKDVMKSLKMPTMILEVVIADSEIVTCSTGGKKG